MPDTTSSLTGFVRRGVAAQDAVDRAAGRFTAAEVDHDADIDRLRGGLAVELDAAIAWTQRAAATLVELTSPAVYDVDYADTDAGRDIATFLDTARRDLAAARALTVYVAGVGR